MRRPACLDPSTRTSVLAAVRAGADAPDAAHARFFDRYAPFVFGAARARGLQPSDADDVVQAVMLQLLRDGGLAAYDRAKGPFRPWLSRLVSWRTEDLRRRAGAAPEPVPDEAFAVLPDTGPAASPAGDALAAAEEAAWRAAAFNEAVRRLRAELPPSHFAAFQASVLEGLPAAAAMRAGGVSRDNLYQIRRRVKPRFDALLSEALRALEDPAAP